MPPQVITDDDRSLRPARPCVAGKHQVCPQCVGYCPPVHRERKLLQIKNKRVVFSGDLHGSLGVLCRVLWASNCVRAGPPGCGAEEEAAAWRRLLALSDVCNAGMERPAFPDPGLLQRLRYDPRSGTSLVFCGDIIDNRRPHEVSRDPVADGGGHGRCAYADAVDLVAATVSQLCAQSAESAPGGVVWLIGNHDLWVFQPETQHMCRGYGQKANCTSGGEYSMAFRARILGLLQAARAQAVMVANGVLACHGGLHAGFVAAVSAKLPEPCPQHRQHSIRHAVLAATNRMCDALLQAVEKSPDKKLGPEDRKRFALLTGPTSPFWCRPSAGDSASFLQLFDPKAFPQGRQRHIPRAFEQFAFVCAHSVHPAVSRVRWSEPLHEARPLPPDRPEPIEPRDVFFVDTGASEGFGGDDRPGAPGGTQRRVVQVTVVAGRAVTVSPNLLDRPGWRVARQKKGGCPPRHSAG
jgi:hypothetical protein